jgi:rare lipoprotein A
MGRGSWSAIKSANNREATFTITEREVEILTPASARLRRLSRRRGDGLNGFAPACSAFGDAGGRLVAVDGFIVVEQRRTDGCSSTASRNNPIELLQRMGRRRSFPWRRRNMRDAVMRALLPAETEPTAAFTGRIEMRRLLVAVALSGISPAVAGARDSTSARADYEGIASQYGEGADGSPDRHFMGRPTASGEIFNASEFTASSVRLRDAQGRLLRTPLIPLGTTLRVVNATDPRRFVIVRVNDTGPLRPGRILDLSPAAMRHLTGRAYNTVRVRACGCGRRWRVFRHPRWRVPLART